jgi:hypothetical protein
MEKKEDKEAMLNKSLYLALSHLNKEVTPKINEKRNDLIV